MADRSKFCIDVGSPVRVNDPPVPASKQRKNTGIFRIAPVLQMDVRRLGFLLGAIKVERPRQCTLDSAGTIGYVEIPDFRESIDVGELLKCSSE